MVFPVWLTAIFFPSKRFHKLCLKVVYTVVRTELGTECAKKSSKCIQWGQCVLDWRNSRCLKSVKSTPSTWRMFLSNQLSYVQCKSNIRVFCVNAWTLDNTLNSNKRNVNNLAHLFDSDKISGFLQMVIIILFQRLQSHMQIWTFNLFFCFLQNVIPV